MAQLHFNSHGLNALFARTEAVFLSGGPGRFQTSQTPLIQMIELAPRQVT